MLCKEWLCMSEKESETNSPPTKPLCLRVQQITRSCIGRVWSCGVYTINLKFCLENKCLFTLCPLHLSTLIAQPELEFRWLHSDLWGGVVVSPPDEDGERCLGAVSQRGSGPPWRGEDLPLCQTGVLDRWEGEDDSRHKLTELLALYCSMLWVLVWVIDVIRSFSLWLILLNWTLKICFYCIKGLQNKWIQISKLWFLFSGLPYNFKLLQMSDFYICVDELSVVNVKGRNMIPI